ncbi:CARDB domain-containing protein [Natrinema salaciae]|uniref:CARDB protein n=1 Tax=Natrinema salaciae TaxID=1186196 RepID=A0A1H9MSY7_9EURY|nr:CARDB domain-containing protein [Natrinema salaciae]SER26545.1 CARDB protein [Natrinema salaciae]
MHLPNISYLLLSVLILAFVVPTAAVTIQTDTPTEDVVLEPAPSSNGKYATVEDGEIRLDLEALNDRAVTTADDVFTITVTDDAVERIWIDHDVPGLSFYERGDPSATITDSNPLEPAAGETTSVGVAVDTHVARSGTETFTVNVRYRDEGSSVGGPPETVPPSPAVNLTSLDVSPTTLATGETVTVNATYRNEGRDSGNVTSRLTVDGTVVDRRSFALEPNETKSVRFVRAMDWPGTYEVGVDGAETRPVTVDGPPIHVVNASVDDPSVTAGDAARVRATVRNPTDTRVDRTLEFAVDGIVVDSRAVSIPANGARTVTVERRFDESGRYEVGVSGVPAGTVTVDERAGISIRNRELSAATTAALAPPATAGLLFLAVAANRRWAFVR